MGNYFWGWYLKCQSEHQTLALIPALHKNQGKTSCSIQLITDQGAWNAEYPFSAFQQTPFGIRIGESEFGSQGIRLRIAAKDLSATGTVTFTGLTPIQYDIMGPFRYMPFMECRHSVISMAHRVTGELVINGTPYRFQNGTGYWEGDRGRSFPKAYAWTQCSRPEGSIMLSVAQIPMGPFRFTGVIGIVLWQGKEHRLATYLGAKVIHIRNREILIRQGSKYLHIRQLDQAAQPLRAPQGGAMNRTIHEHASCKVRYRFRDGGHTLFDFEASNASWEYEYPN